MDVIRRVYIYLVSLVSLQAVAWAVIALLRDLFLRGRGWPIDDTAYKLAFIVVGLPIYLVHWLWAQRLAGREPAERRATLRGLYLYVAMASFLGPFVASAGGLLSNLVWLAVGYKPSRYSWELSQGDAAVHLLVSAVVMAVLWFYHNRVWAADTKAVPQAGAAATLRRLYVYGFSAAGLALTAVSAAALLRWLMLHLGTARAIGGWENTVDDMTRLVVGLALWLAFWRHVAQPDQEERTSIVRTPYLYGVVFVSVLATVTAATFILEGLLRRLFGISTSGGPGGNLQDPVSVILVAGTIWAYHTYILRRDITQAGKIAPQAWAGRLYRYLVAGVGLAVFLVGLGGLVSVLIRFLSGVSFVTGVPAEVSWFTAALIAGLAVWILPWRRCQILAGARNPEGDAESRSLIRRIYLYFFLFAATMVMLGSGVSLVRRLISLLLGEPRRGNFWAGAGQEIAFALIAAGVLLYHGILQRADGRRAKLADSRSLAAVRITVVDDGDGSLGRALLDELERELPGARLQPLGLTPEAAAAMGAGVELADTAGLLAESEIIVGPWTIAASAAKVADAVAASPARRLLIPVEQEGWTWAGVQDASRKKLVGQAADAVRRMVAGERGRQDWPLSNGVTVIIAFVLLLLLAACFFLLGPVQFTD
jgi:Domain of unknown function (DUF5671)/Domain of unknown function (DUF3842)